MSSVIYIRSLLQGGAEKQALLLAEELQKKTDVTVIVHTHHNDNGYHEFNHIRQLFFLKGNALAKFLSLVKFLRKNRPDNLICYLPVNNILGTFAGKITGVRNILCGIRGSKNKGRIRTVLLKFICNVLNTRFISNSSKSKEMYVEYGFKSSNISVIHNGIVVPHENEIINRTLQDKPVFNLLSVGRFIPEKDIPTLLKAIDHLLHSLKFTAFRLILVGYGPLENSIRKQLDELNLSEKVEIVEGQKADMNKMYREADIYILSSVFEGMPNTVMEAMSYKLPVISTDAGDAHFLVDEHNGCLVDKGDFVKIAEQIKYILEDPSLYKLCSANSFAKINDHFSAEKMAIEYSKYLIL